MLQHPILLGPLLVVMLLNCPGKLCLYCGWPSCFGYISLSFFFFYVPSSRVHHFWRDFCVCDCLMVQLEVVTFLLHRYCMLGVLLLPAFTRLGHECQDRLSPCDGMHVFTDSTSFYTLIWKSFWRMESETMLTPRKKSPAGGSEEVRTHDAA